MIQSNVSADFTFFLLPAYSNPEISSNPPRRNPWFWLVVLVIIMMTSSYRAWRSKWQIIGITPTQLLADDSALIGRFPEKPRNYPKRNFNRWKPFSYEFVIAADSHIQTFIEVKTSDSTSGREIYFRLETNRENPLPVGVSKWKLYRLLQCFYCI